jgi:hypothetical protein
LRAAEDEAVIFLKPVEGYAVKIWRADGTHFLASSGPFGVAVLVWPKNMRKNAVAFARDDVPELKTKVVRVHFAHPVEIPAGKR